MITMKDPERKALTVEDGELNKPRDAEGIERVIDSNHRNPEIESRFNLHIGKPYRTMVDVCVYDGIMTSVKIIDWEKTFQLLDVTLEEGLFFHAADPDDKHYLDNGRFSPQKVTGIMDEEGFLRVRDRIRNKYTQISMSFEYQKRDGNTPKQ